MRHTTALRVVMRRREKFRIDDLLSLKIKGDRTNRDVPSPLIPSGGVVVGDR
jgi:hypothetical protein